MNNKLLFNTLFGIIFVSVLGTLFHFVYDWSGQNSFVGLFTAVNESTWEHMKLMFFPMLLFFLLEKRLLPNATFSKESPNAATILIGTWLIPVLFYTYSGILGTNYSALDIATFYISVIVAFSFRYWFIENDREKHHTLLLTIGVLVMFFAFIFFTYNPPKLGIFISPV